MSGLVTALQLCDDQAPSWELMPSAPVRRILALVGLGRIRSGESGGWLALLRGSVGYTVAHDRVRRERVDQPVAILDAERFEQE